MFRKPRTNNGQEVIEQIKPSVGRPPTSPHSPPPLFTHGSTISAPSSISMTSVAIRTPSTLSSAGTKNDGTSIAQQASKGTSAGRNNKVKSVGNASILTFFKKVDVDKDPESLFLAENTGRNGLPRTAPAKTPPKNTATDSQPFESPSLEDDVRFNEFETPSKRRKVSPELVQNCDVDVDTKKSKTIMGVEDGVEVSVSGKTSVNGNATGKKEERTTSRPTSRPSSANGGIRRRGPFLDDSDTDTEIPFVQRPQAPMVKTQDAIPDASAHVTADVETTEPQVKLECDGEPTVIDPAPASEPLPPPLKREATSYADGDGFADFEGMEDFDDEFADGEEVAARRLMMQERAEMEGEAGFEGDFEGDEYGFEDEDLDEKDAVKTEPQEEDDIAEPAVASCPICSASFAGISDQEASVHVNHCLDGNPTPLPAPKSMPKLVTKKEDDVKEKPKPAAAKFRRPARPAKPGQESPFMLGQPNGTGSAFSMLMSGHAEDAAWASAAAAEHAARGKPAFQRTCPFYKVLPGLHICVDAFRYGAVEGCNAYFLSHFHSDHYIGLTSTWCHGPIYCSGITARLVKQQLRVDPRYVVALEFEEKLEVPGTDGVHVTMIPANHCPGSSLYLFEKVVGKGKIPKVQRILHCGDFRACPAHVEHPLLRPDVMDAVTGKTAQQKIDVCYLDTTYLNPKYAFPSQEDVIQACADMCVSLSKQKVDKTDDYEQMKAERAGGAMAKFMRTNSKGETESTTCPDAAESTTDLRPPLSKPKDSTRGRLLVVVGTYSIGKERICIGIARALNSKIYAPPGKQRICAALQDPELNKLLTTNPREAQVHMTPLFEIRAETLGDYLAEFGDSFTRCVGFRPSGWNYRPPGSRFVESPAVSTVLSSDNWKSVYSMRELVPQRGSTTRAACYGVPYSEHSSFRELTMFCCALRIEKVIPTVNVGSKVGRERMKAWCERWAMERKKNGLWTGEWYPGRGTRELRTTL